MLTPTFTVIEQEVDSQKSVFTIEPLEKGYGHTLGNALRRTLLNSLPGAAPTQIKVKGVRHQFSTLKGMSEDIVEFILNIKGLRVKYEGDEPITLELSAQGPGEVKASQINTPANVKIVNKDKVLAVLADKKATLEAEIQIERGTGYSPSEERKSNKIGVIPVDATFSPIQKVSYRIETTRVGRRTDLDRLIIEVESDGTITPKNALEESAKLLQAYFKQVFEPKVVKEEKKEEDELGNDEVYRLTVEELDLPTRIANALRKGGYKTVKELMGASHNDLAQVKNLGEKSVDLIRKALKKKDLVMKG
jgi:DNA-directed RNA polymerase subunit alpha